MKTYVHILNLFFFFLITLSATNTVKAEKMHGIAMHGAPALKADDTHLPYANPDAPQGGTLKHCAIGTFDTLNDNTIKGKSAKDLHLIHDPLMRRVWSEPFTLYGLIAQYADIPDDRSSITFHLNPKARFHDGSPITTADVKFSFETLRENGKPNTQNIYNKVDKVTVTNDHIIRFSLKKPHGREEILILAKMPILSKSYWTNRDFGDTTLDIPVGSGPYEIESVDPGKKITYIKNPDYWAADLPINRGHFNFERLSYDYYRDQQIAIEAFKSGDCDVRREFNPAKWDNLYTDDEGYTRENLKHGRPEPAKGFIFNTRRAPLDNLAVRQALQLAFDFEWVNKTLLRGQGKRITSTFPNTSLAGDFAFPTTNKRARLKQADAALSQAGFALVDGKRFDLTILLNNPAEEKIALAYARDLKRLGITLNIRTLDTAQFFGALNDYDYDMISWRWINSLSPGTEQNIYWGCDAAKTSGSRNYTGICDDQIETAITALNTTTEYDDLITKTRFLDKLIMEQSLFIPLYYTGLDHVAYWPSIAHPVEQSLYGMVLETWWHKTP